MNEELNKVQENSTENQPINDEKTNVPEESETGNELESLKIQIQECNDKFLRLYAEFDNFKRRTVKERSETLQTAGKEVILALLPVMDDFERAHRAQSTNDFEAYKAGIELIHQKFSGILESRGLKSIESVGKDFNVDLHEAITNVPAPNEEMKGKVIDETEKGYTLNGHLIRFAKVIVAE